MKSTIPSLHKLLLSLIAIVALAPLSGATTFTKANNNNNLNLASSWVGNSTVPGPGDIALWDSTVTSSSQTSLGANLDWLGIQITNPTGIVFIGPSNVGANTLTLGVSGIDASASTQRVILRTPIALSANQTWNFGTQDADIGQGAAISTVTNGGNTLTINGTSTNLYLLDNLTGAGGLTFVGSGSLNITGASTYTGNTIVNGKTSLGNGGTTGSINSSSIVTSTATLGSSNAIFQIFKTTDLTFANNMTGNVELNKFAANNVTLAGASSYLGSNKIYNGALTVSTINSVTTNATLGTVHSATSNLGAQTSVGRATIDFGTSATGGQLTYIGTGETTDRIINLNGTTGGATLDQSGTGLLKFVSNLTAGGAGSKTLTLQGSTAGTGEISGVIVNNSGTNKTSLTKAGTGTWKLSGINTYSGATLVSSGTLVLSGSGSINSSAVTVNGGTFRNNSSTNYTGALTFTSGAVGGTNLNGSLGGLTIGTGQTLSPGNSPGTAVTTSQTWAGGGTYLWEINNATGAAGADPGWDLLSGTGALTISATSGSKFNIAITSLDLTNAAGNAANFNGLTTNYQWKIADFGSAISLDPTAFNLNTAAFSNAVQVGSTWAIVLGNAPGITGGDNTQLWVTYTIPEPTTWALLAFSLTTVMVLRRRRA